MTILQVRRIFFHDGSSYAGLFETAILMGEDGLLVADGSSYEGEWKDNVLRQKSRRINPFLPMQIEKPANGSFGQKKIVNVNFCDGEKGQYRYRDGSLYTEIFAAGKTRWRRWKRYANGDVYKGAEELWSVWLWYHDKKDVYLVGFGNLSAQAAVIRNRSPGQSQQGNKQVTQKAMRPNIRGGRYATYNHMGFIAVYGWRCLPFVARVFLKISRAVLYLMIISAS